MDEKYKIFQKGYNKTLDLLSDVDSELIDKYILIIKFLPKQVLKSISTCKDFSTDVENAEFYAEMLAFNNGLDFDFTRYKNYLRIELKICRYFVEQLYQDSEPIELFNLKLRNQEVKQPELRVFFEQKDGKLVFCGDDNKAAPNYLDIEYQAFIEREEDKYVVISRKMIRGWVVYEKRYDAFLDELIQCVETDDNYVKDETVEFDADFDLN